MDVERPSEEAGEADRHDYVASWTGPPPPVRDRLAVARDGSTAERWRLAGEDDLDDEVVHLLLHSGDTDVAASLAGNSAVPTGALGDLAELHPEHRHWIGLNPEAPVHLKEAVPIGDHSTYALLRYYEQRDASDDVRRAIDQRYEDSPHPGGPLLGDVYREVAAEA